MANKCPMCRYDINTGKPFEESAYPVPENDNHYSEYDSEDEYFEYELYSDSETEDTEQHAVTTPYVPSEELQPYYATPYHSTIITQPVQLSNLANYSDTGSAFYTSEKYDCLATNNPRINGITIQYQTKPPLSPITNQRDFYCDGVPRCVSIQTTQTTCVLYVLIVYPDDGECDKMIIYFPHTSSIIMSAFREKLYESACCLDNLQITKFGSGKQAVDNVIYLGNDIYVPNGLLADVIEFQKLKTIYEQFRQEEHG